MTFERSLVWFLFLICLILSQIRFANGIQEIYEWKSESKSGKGTIHSLSLTTPQIWRVDTETNITFRFELKSKGPSYNYTEPVLLLIKVHAGTDRARQLKSENYANNTFLRTAGDCWEKNISFSIPAESLPRGETKVSWIMFELVYNERYLDQVQGSQIWKKSTDWYYYDPSIHELAMNFQIYRPFMSTIEWIAVISIITFGACVLGFIIYKKTIMKSNTRVE